MTDSAPLPSTVFYANRSKALPTEFGERCRLVDQRTATFQRLEICGDTLNPGASSLSEHGHPEEKFVIVEDGRLEVTIQGETVSVGPGSLVFLAANDVHGMRNAGGARASYFAFKFTTSSTRNVPPAARSPQSQQLASSVYDWSKLPVMKTIVGARRDLCDSSTATCANLECHVTTLDPGAQPHPVHHHDDEEFIVVKEGLLQATVEGAAREPAGPGSILFFASGDRHEIRNVGDGPTTYHVLRIVTDLPPA